MAPTHGELHVLGRSLEIPLVPADLRRLRTEIGQVMQGLHLVLRMSSLDNVLMGLLGRRSGWRTWLRVPIHEDVKAAKAALAAVGMLPKADARADTLSGGERQKVAIARMLMQSPSLILADEPTASLDPLAAAEVCSVLAHAAQGATLVSVVHNPSLLPILATRVIGLKQGRLEFDVAIDELSDARLTNLYRPGNAQPLEPWAVLSNVTSTKATHGY
jgi:phosphonate transport system ATP-binding protein